MTVPIAVVGMGARYPDATGHEQLWENSLAGRQAFRRLPLARLGADYRGERTDPDRTYLTHAAVLRDWDFDRTAYGVSGSLHRAVDHTHWLALETASAALADAGYPRGDGLDRDRVGVVLGNSLAGEFTRAAQLRYRWPFIAEASTAALVEAGVSDDVIAVALQGLEARVKHPFPAPGDESLAGALANTIAGRICNTFDLHGTGFTVDGACSSSLLSVAQACSALVADDLDVALAGGVDMSIDPLEVVGFSRLGALAENEMRVYDARPTGFLPGEGCGLVVLMRSDEARRRGCRIYAEILGWATSTDGAGGLTRPVTSGQVLSLQRAYRRAGLHPDAAALFEGHGTGTAIGDEVELTALSHVRSASADPAVLGSIKANIGHTKAAAGAAGLIKAVSAVHRQILPPATGCVTPHPMLTGRGRKLQLLQQAREWSGPRLVAGVSSMGFGGINAHVVVGSVDGKRPRRTIRERLWSRRPGEHEIVMISVPEPRMVRNQLRELAAVAADLSIAEIRDLAATTWHRGQRGAARAALVARSAEELVSAAQAAADAAGSWTGGPLFDVRAGWALGNGTAKLGLVFPGQAAPVRPELPSWAHRRFDLPAAADGVVDTAVAQPVIVASTLAGVEWLERLGCDAVAAVGHSLGEISGLVWAGALAPEAAVLLAAERGRLMAAHGRAGTGMAGVAAAVDDVLTRIDGTALEIAAINSAAHTVVAGPITELEELVVRLREDGIAGQRLPVSHGFHSAAMKAVAAPLRETLDTVPFTAPTAALISTVSGGLHDPDVDAAELRDVLVKQLTEPVRYRQAIEQLTAMTDLVVEIGPGAMLSTLAALDGAAVPVVAMDVGGDPRAHATATAVLAATCGAELDDWFADRPHRALPDTPPRFMTGPCETTPTVPPADGADVDPPRRPGAPQPPVSVPPRSTTVVPCTRPMLTPTDDPAPATGAPDRRCTSTTLDTVISYLARTLELPDEEFTEHLSLLDDLHLSSLQVVQLVVGVAGELGVEPPGPPQTMERLTVRDLVDLLDAPPVEDAAVPQAAEPVDRWIRTLSDEWVRFEPAVAGPPGPLTLFVGRWRHRPGTPGTNSPAPRTTRRSSCGGSPSRSLPTTASTRSRTCFAAWATSRPTGCSSATIPIPRPWEWPARRSPSWASPPSSSTSSTTTRRPSRAMSNASCPTRCAGANCASGATERCGPGPPDSQRSPHPPRAGRWPRRTSCS